MLIDIVIQHLLFWVYGLERYTHVGTLRLGAYHSGGANLLDASILIAYVIVDRASITSPALQVVGGARNAIDLKSKYMCAGYGRFYPRDGILLVNRPKQ